MAANIHKKSYYNGLFGEIQNVYVEKDYRSQGIGRKFFEDFCKYCAENRVDRIDINASFNNKRAVEFYKKCGFRPVDITLTQEVR
jgi:ribosomal protein S18 acetylase RimI-like enzyme